VSAHGRNLDQGDVASIIGISLPKARRFNELPVEGTAKPTPALKLIETDIRDVRDDRDMVLGEAVSPSAA
jgi:hypothetical protein